MDTKSLIERLRKGQLSYRLDSGGVYHGGDALHMEAADALASQAAEIERLRESLKPFSLIAETDACMDSRDADEDEWFRFDGAVLHVGDFRRARAALNGEKP